MKDDVSDKNYIDGEMMTRNAKKGRKKIKEQKEDKKITETKEEKRSW